MPIRQRIFPRTTFAILAAAAALSALGAALAQTSRLPLTLTAFAVNLGGVRPPSRPGTSPVTIKIERWSAPDERRQLVEMLMKGGPDRLLSALRKTPRTGYLRTPDSVGWNLHYAHEEPVEGAGRRIVLATDRPLGFWELYHRTRSLDYPFTLIEIRLDESGKGEGRMSVATRITSRGDTIEIENYSSELVRLQSVRVEQGE